MEHGYTEAVRDFYRVYRPIQKKYNLRMHSHESLTDDAEIEIWQYAGETKGRLVCNATEESATECYRKITEQLIRYDEMKKGKENGRIHADHIE